MVRNRKKVILFYPKVEMKKTEGSIPLSLLAVAAPLLQNGFEPVIIDESIEGNYKDHLFEAAKDSICFCVTAMTGPQIDLALKASMLIRENFPLLPIIWGGWHPSILPHQTASHSLVDIVVKGQGEHTLLEVVSSLSNKGDISKISGIIYKRNGNIIINKDRPFCDVNEFPPIPFHLLDIKRYMGKERHISYSSSRGCPYRCGFCANLTVYHRRWCGLSEERVLNDLENLHKNYGVEYVDFVDTNFFINKNRLRAICQGIIDCDLKIKWSASVRAEQIVGLEKDLMDLVKRSGFSLAALGLESGSQRILDMINKDEKVEDAYQCINILREYEIGAVGTLMVGIPGETEDDREKTYRLVKEIKEQYKKTRLVILFYTPYPGTPLYQKSIEFGMEEPQSLEDWAKFSHNNINIPWLDKSIEKEIEKAVTGIYSVDFESVLRKLSIKGEKNIVLYGAGDTARIAFDVANSLGLNILAFADSNREKWGKRFLDHVIISPEEIVSAKPQAVAITSYGYQEEIYEDIKHLNQEGIEVVKLYQNIVAYLI